MNAVTPESFTMSLNYRKINAANFFSLFIKLASAYPFNVYGFKTDFVGIFPIKTNALLSKLETAIAVVCELYPHAPKMQTASQFMSYLMQLTRSTLIQLVKYKNDKILL